MSAPTQDTNQKNQLSIKKLLSGLIALTLAISGLTGYSIIQDQNNTPKDSFASAVYGCSAGETLAGTSCLSNKAEIENYTLGCKAGYTPMDTTCSKFESKPCTSYNKGMDAEAGWCKFEPVTIYGGEILNFDGRECNGTGYSYYRYNVGLTFNDTTGPIVCGNTLSLVSGQDNFRWMPKSILEISNFETIKGVSTYSQCPIGYSDAGIQCSRPATIKSCSSSEILGSIFNPIRTLAEQNTTLTTIQNSTLIGNNQSLSNNATPIVTDDLNKSTDIYSDTNIYNYDIYGNNSSSIQSSSQSSDQLLISTVNSTSLVNVNLLLESSSSTSSAFTLESNQSIDPSTSSCKPCPINSYCTAQTTTNLKCGQGSDLIGSKCQADIKVTQITYSDGCAPEYIKLDKTCAIKQIRDHDFGCSYYFASNYEFITAVDMPDGKCSTGGRTDFDSTNIFKVDGPECAGPGTQWYNYNVAYDPLVCGFTTYNPNDKAAFRWSADSYIKITGLQKIPTQSYICPTNWTPDVGDDNLCEQDPINLIYTSATPCPPGTTSPANSTSATACIAPISSSSVTSSSSSSSIISTSTNTSISSVSSSSTAKVENSFITITNSSSSLAASSAILTTPGCINAPIGTFGNSANPTCLPCPAGKTTQSEGAKSADQCVAIAIVAVTNPASTVITTRTGGLATLSLIFMLASAITAAYIYADSHLKQGVHSGWKKLK
jgi:hypothetical protein